MSETPRDPSIDAIHAAETPEQAARQLLDRMGVEDALTWTSGDVVELANLLHEVRGIRREDARLLRDAVVFEPHGEPPEPDHEGEERLEALADLLERLSPSENGP